MREGDRQGQRGGGGERETYTEGQTGETETDTQTEGADRVGGGEEKRQRDDRKRGRWTDGREMRAG